MIVNQTEHNLRLTSAELAFLWSNYQADSLSSCVLKYFLEKVEDKEIKPVVEYALQLAKKHLQTIEEILNHEDIPIPHAFSEKDVNIHAPKLFDDIFIISYVHHLSRLALQMYGYNYPITVRSDIHDFAKECMASTTELEDQARQVKLSKGIYTKPPLIPMPKKVDFVKQQSFLTGWFGDRRPLTAIEITNLYVNIQTNSLGKALIMGFAQVAKSEKIKEYFVRGRDIASKHIEVFHSILNNEHIPAPMSWDHNVLDSTVAPFSDKLMLAHINSINASGQVNYGIAVSSSPRRDLISHYMRLQMEVMKYTEDGINIMIDEGWLEQPPHTVDRDALVHQ